VRTIKDKGFIRDSFIMIVASLLAGFFNYLYQLSMGRLLPPEDYGVLISLLSLLYIFSMISMTINTSAAKFSSVYKVRGEYGKIKVMLFKASRGLSLLVLLLVAILLILSPYIAAFLDVDPFLVLVLILAIPPLLILPLPQGILRGLQRFVVLGTTNVSPAVVKFLVGVSLVLLGFGVFGSLVGAVVAPVLGVILAFVFLRGIIGLDSSSDSIELRDMLRYSGFAFVALFCYNTMWNVDVVLVKHYFTPFETGLYSAVSILGRIILFASAAIPMVVFPKASDMYEAGGKHFHMLLKGLVLTFLISGGILLAYLLFPDKIVMTIFGEGYAGAIPYLSKYGLVTFFFSLTGLLVSYSLSINQHGTAIPLFIFLVAEVLLISYCSTISEVINMMIIISLLTCITMLVYVWRGRG
jgi:O-antigen/teichoic acid export membrane protein